MPTKNRFKFINTSSPGRTIYVIEAGRTLAPGDFVTANRCEDSTRDTPGLTVEEGEFDPVPRDKPKPKVESVTATEQGGNVVKVGGSKPLVVHAPNDPLPGKWDSAAMRRVPDARPRAHVTTVSAKDIAYAPVPSTGADLREPPRGPSNAEDFARALK